MRKTKKTSSAPIKARSLSELRDLQRQASKQTELTHGAGHPPQPGHGFSDDRALSGAQTKRRPHRFLPPGLKLDLGVSQAKGSGMAANKTGSGHPDVRPESTAARPSRHILDTTPNTAISPSQSHNEAPRSTTPSGSYSTSNKQFKAGGSPDTPASSLDNDDVALFRRVVQSVTPAATSNRALLPPVPSATAAQLQQRRQHAMGQRITTALDVSDQYASVGIDHDDTAFLQTGQGPHLIKGLKKGKWQVQASLDLHGSNLDEARERMDRFILSCRDHQIRCVRIVHGKGHGSKNGDPVLKDTVRRWLSQLAVVQAYIESDEANGGAGAVLVLLSKNKP